MAKYRVGIDITREIEAIDEEDAVEKFYEEIESANDRIENYLFINEVK